MVYSGYLTINGRLDDGRYLVRIPNMEIINFFKDEFLTIVFGNYDKVDRLRDALRDKSLTQVNKSIEELVLYTMSSQDITKHYENPYHMLLLGFFYALDGYYFPKSNMEVGYGRADIILFPRDKTKAEYIFELKRANSNDLEEEVQKALQQIEDRKYYIELEKYGVKEIVKVGYVFDGKRVISRYR